MEYKTTDSLIAEIRSSGEFFKDNPALLDKPSIYRWVYLALKQFGLNIMQKKGKVIHVEDYRTLLPNDFGKLSLAVFCEYDKCFVSEENKEKLLSTYFYKDTIQTKYVIESTQSKDSSCETEKCKESETHIVEKFFLSEADCNLTLRYKNPCFVRLGRDIIYDSCIEGCINKQVLDSPFSINIKGQTVYASFEKGALYLEYYAIPSDEDGIPLIPVNLSSRGKLEEYLEYMIKRKILENAMLSKDATDLFTMFNYIVAKERELFREAQADLTKLDMKAFWSYIDRTRKDNHRFDIMLK